ncbi:hypothetical protein [Weissella viridescens]|uniref:hypothetical protein n=1 Tax=Weissella viridescens TaxID=1629 RepID=UPI004055FDE2
MAEKNLTINAKETAEIIGYSPKYFSTWRHGDSKRAQRFRRVVKETDPNWFNKRSVERFNEGALM